MDVVCRLPGAATFWRDGYQRFDGFRHGAIQPTVLANGIEELIAALGLSVASFPEIASSQQTFNRLGNAYRSRWPQLSEARLFPAVGDGAANSIGSGCHSTEKLALMIGTSGAMRVCFVGAPPDRLPPELWCYRASRDRVLIGGALSDGGGLFNWLKESLLPGESFAMVGE